MAIFVRKQIEFKWNNDPVLREKLGRKHQLGCLRFTIGTGDLEASTRSDVHLTKSDISRIAAENIHTLDGIFHHLDVIVCATGFDVSPISNFPTLSRNLISLAEK